MKAKSLYLAAMLPLLFACSTEQKQQVALFPAPSSTGNSADVQLRLTFSQKTPALGSSGKISVYDASTDQLVDCIDVSLPAGPTEKRQEPSNPHYLSTPYNYSRSKVATNRDTKAGKASHEEAVETEEQRGNYQSTIIGGFTDGFHFYPVLIRDSVVTIQLHHNKLQYGHRYYVVVDDGVIQLPDGSFHGIDKEQGWQFATRGNGPSLDKGVLTVKTDGTGDFNTIQGALDYVPDSLADTLTIKVAAGTYEEIVYFRNKTHLRIVGEGKDKTILHYLNNETFNPHPFGVTTNEQKGTFPSRRAVMSVDNCDDIAIEDLSIINDTEAGQSEGLLINSERVAVRRCFIKGDRDAFQPNGTTYIEDSELEGGHDMIMSRGALFAYRTSFKNQGGPFSWPRNDKSSHGLVFVECEFIGSSGISDYGRTNSNKGKKYSDAEMVLINCKERNVSPGGWSVICSRDCYFAEYNTTYRADGEVIDYTSRHPYSRWLDATRDAQTIKQFSDPEFVLNGWNPRQ